MALIPQTQIDVGTIVTVIEQRIALGSQFDGGAPELAGEAFTPYANEADGLIVMAQHDDSTKRAGDKGGLFTVNLEGPCAFEYLIADLGTKAGGVTWTLSIVTSQGAQPLANDVGRYLVRKETERIYLLPGDQIKLVTTDADSAMWARVGFTLAQGTH